MIAIIKEKFAGFFIFEEGQKLKAGFNGILNLRSSLEFREKNRCRTYSLA